MLYPQKTSFSKRKSGCLHSFYGTLCSMELVSQHHLFTRTFLLSSILHGKPGHFDPWSHAVRGEKQVLQQQQLTVLEKYSGGQPSGYVMGIQSGNGCFSMFIVLEPQPWTRKNSVIRLVTANICIRKYKCHWPTKKRVRRNSILVQHFKHLTYIL